MNMSVKYLKYANELFNLRSNLLSILPSIKEDDGRIEIREKIREIELDIYTRLNLNYLEKKLEQLKNEQSNK